MRLLEGKTLLITGCNRGIGKETVKIFATNGANIICCIRKQSDEFDEFIMTLAAENSVEIRTILADLSEEESVKDVFRTVVKEKIPVDILINNAGVATGGFLQMTPMAKVKEVFQINFFSLVLITQIVSKIMMRRKQGVIINMGSVAGLDNFPGYTSYGSSKAAVMAFTRTIANELAPYNIRVNAVAPGLTDTGMADQMEEKAWKEMVDRTDMKRLGRPMEIAKTLLFLASDESSFITGQVVRVDGGM